MGLQTIKKRAKTTKNMRWSLVLPSIATKQNLHYAWTATKVFLRKLHTKLLVAVEIHLPGLPVAVKSHKQVSSRLLRPILRLRKWLKECVTFR